MRRLIATCLLTLFTLCAHAKDRIVNVYIWSGNVPSSVIEQFQKDTGIKVNFSTYESNEVMLAKLRAASTAGYDVIMPSSYFVGRMKKLNMLEELDKTKLPNIKNLNPDFTNPDYDKGLHYSIPYIWGITGIFYNKQHVKTPIKKWSDLWDKQFKDQVLLLDDTREVFSMALLSLGYSANDSDPAHIKKAYDKLKQLMPNIRVFSSDTATSIMVDEDANIGMSWNGDVFRAIHENNNLNFVFPEDGFIIWMDTFAIPKNAPHKKEAYAFLNYMLRPEPAMATANELNYAVTNLAAQKRLPAEIRNNPIIYPPEKIMKRATFQQDPGKKAVDLYESYWEELKMSG